PAWRIAWARFPAAISALDGTQPWLRQSPPMRPFSTSTTETPNAAAAAATERPPEPAPMTQMSGVRRMLMENCQCGMGRRSAPPQRSYDGRHERDKRQRREGDGDVGGDEIAERGALTRRLGSGKHAVDPLPQPRIGDDAGQDAEERRGDIGPRRHVEQ